MFSEKLFIRHNPMEFPTLSKMKHIFSFGPIVGHRKTVPGAMKHE